MRLQIVLLKTKLKCADKSLVSVHLPEQSLICLQTLNSQQETNHLLLK
jgi:hypothetical protein